MNAAAKALDSASLFRGSIHQLRLSKDFLLMLSLILAVLLSALAIVYVKNEQRQLVSHLQSSYQSANQLKVERGQLLLEQTSLATPSRVQSMAVNQLDMMLPATRQTIIMRQR